MGIKNCYITKCWVWVEVVLYEQQGKKQSKRLNNLQIYSLPIGEAYNNMIILKHFGKEIPS